MVKAVWNDVVLAESDATLLVEGNYYFPPDSVLRDYFKPSDTRTDCHWKGTASYYDIVVDGHINQDAAWSYPDPKAEADYIKGYVAFWNGVVILE